jgi:DNA repair protein RadC
VASVYPREIVKAALGVNAAKVIIAHNHPSGDTTPSEADKRITKRIQEALSTVDIQVIDHIIVGDKENLSFAARGLL